MSSSKEAATSFSNLHEWKYDVFVSFRGGDLRGGFMSHFFNALEQEKINCFRDNDEEDLGKVVESKILEAIHHSRIALAVFSLNYADSKWCLIELAEILERQRNFGVPHHFIPIFYDVKTGDVRRQSGDFGIGFERLKNSPNSKEEQIIRWKKALAKAGEVSGFNLKNDTNGDESLLIGKIARQLCHLLGKQPSHLTANDELFARTATHNEAVAKQTEAILEARRRQTDAHNEAVARGYEEYFKALRIARSNE